MDVHISNFWRELPNVIHTISASDFVAIDLEMSGVQAGNSGPRRKPRPTSAQAIYDEAKEAAETFQIVQLGLSCVVYDEPSKSYHATTFNFFVTPMFTQRLSEFRHQSAALAKYVDRKLCFSYKTLEFLQKNGFRMECAFPLGIPYLSRQECTDLSERFLTLEQEITRAPIDVDSYSEETQDFYRSARRRIEEVLQDDQPGAYWNFTNPFDDDCNVNNLQAQLIRQLIAAEFKGRVRCYFRDTFMQVVKADEQAEQRFLADKLEERRKAVREQYGLLFVIEALAGGSFAKEITAKLRLDEPMAAIMEAAEERLKARRPVLVGHNQFLDLCFLHQTFFGPLPPTLEAFEAEIHASFPRVADTKFMAERGRHEMAPDFNLRDLFLRAKGAATPVIVAALGTPGYPPGIDRSHSAGFDSWMTAVLFVKKAWSLARGAEETASSSPAKSSLGSLQPQAPCFYPKARLHMNGSFSKIAAGASGCLLDDDTDMLSSHMLIKALSPERQRPKSDAVAERTQEKTTSEDPVLSEWKIPD